jgi:hypothetical protein
VWNQTFPIVVNLLHKQIESRNTFFLDTDAFSTTPYAVFVKDIISARTAEFEELQSKPSLREVYSTYYGFTIFSSGRTSSTRAGAAEKGVKCIEELATQFGKKTTLDARIFQPSPKAFTNCTSQTRNLLWNILKMFNGGWDSRSTAAKKIGVIGDSRATDYIIMNLQNTTNHYGKPALLKALGAIGDPKGLGTVLSCLNNSRLRSTAILSLGGIRHPEVLEKLIEIKESSNRRGLISVVTALSITRSKKAIEVLSSLLESRNARIVQKAIEALISIGKDGLEKLDVQSSTIFSALSRSRSLHKMIRLLKRIPSFQWTSDLQRMIARTIDRTHNAFQIINEICGTPELAESNIIIESILQHLKKMARYRWNKWYIQRLTRKGNIQKLLAKAIRKSESPQQIILRISNYPELTADYEIKQAIEYVRRRDKSPKSPVAQENQSPKTVIAKQKSSPKQPAFMQQSLIDYLENIVEIDIEFSKKHRDTE